MLNQALTMNKMIPFTLLKLGRTPLETRYVREATVFVFRDEPTWIAFWRNSSLPRLSLRASMLPRVDFTTQMVMGITAGFRPTGGYHLQIDAIEVAKDVEMERWVIHYTEQMPDRCVLTQQPTTPSLFILTAQSNAAIALQGKTLTYTYAE